MNPKDPTPGERIVTSSRSHSTGLIDQVIKSCEPTKILAVGGAGHKVILLMEGVAHCYVMASPGQEITQSGWKIPQTESAI